MGLVVALMWVTVRILGLLHVLLCGLSVESSWNTNKPFNDVTLPITLNQACIHFAALKRFMLLLDSRCARNFLCQIYLRQLFQVHRVSSYSNDISKDITIRGIMLYYENLVLSSDA
jgi:hypothetical protein